MFELLKNTDLQPVFSKEKVAGYRVSGGDFLNQYYLVSAPGTRKLLNQPEVVGYEVYDCMLDATVGMMGYLNKAGWVRSANILSILRGALNYPLEESCYRSGIRIHDISFLSSERVFHDDEITGLEIKYSKLAAVPDSTLLIGDIIATGDTLVHCLHYVVDFYRKHQAKLRNIIVFTIGGNTGIEIMEELTKEFRKFWPEFEGFIAVYYEGIFNTYKEKGVSGINLPYVDFYWKDGIVTPEYRRQTLQNRNTLFEKCTIYDGGARRYEILDHIEEVLEYWEGMLERADRINLKELTDEKLGYSTPVSLEEWKDYNHYKKLPEQLCEQLYEQERAYIRSLEGVTVKPIAEQRISEFKNALSEYMI